MTARVAVRLITLLCAHLIVWWPAHAAGVRIGASAQVPENPRSRYNRHVNFRPGDGERVKLNPPRLSWPYWPRFPEGVQRESHSFTLQIAPSADFAGPVINVTSRHNFYNTFGALDGPGPWYWRVGYDIGTTKAVWSPARSFTIASDAVVWDRSALAEGPPPTHPRILFAADSLPAIRKLKDTDPGSKAAYEYIISRADKDIRADWWLNFPKTDTAKEPDTSFHSIARELTIVCFAWVLTQDEKYSPVKERAVTLASYPQGGRASPEGAGGDSAEDSTQVNEYLALLFDWLYPVLSEAERRVMIQSLEWRTDYWMNSFAWQRRNQTGPMVRLTFRKGDEHLGDVRLRLQGSDTWQEFEWQAPVPEQATSARAEYFNYYRAGKVWWTDPAIRSGPAQDNLLSNARLGNVANKTPARWYYSRYSTSSRPIFADAAVGIDCPSDKDRGAWGQEIRVKGGEPLRVTGRYKTEGLAPGMVVDPTSLAGNCSSHQFEGSMDSAPMGLALYEHSALGRQWYELMLNYLIGVTNGFGFDESWNEGPGYGTSKMKWLMNATLYFDTALPGAELGKNPYYRAIGDFFARITPVGLPHSPWGNGSANQGYYRGGRLANFRRLAYLTGEGRFLRNYKESGGKLFGSMRPWIEYVLPHYYQEPQEALEEDNTHLFGIDGWVTSASYPPSSAQGFNEGVGIIFQARSRGGYSHSFNSDNSFQIHAYGRQVNHGGGGTTNKDAYAYHTMSHNTLLVDGLGQAQPGGVMRRSTYARIVAFDRGDQYVYFAGDATGAYPREPGNYTRWGLPLHPVYKQRAVPHLSRFVRHVLFVRNRYFVVYDDLKASKPAAFTWLYHVLPERPFSLDAKAATVRYTVGDVPVTVSHIAHRDNLAVDDRIGEDALVNPFTQEDYRRWRIGDLLCGHNLWVTNRTPATEFNFLTVIYPQKPGSAEPTIERIDDQTVRVDGDMITFAPSRHAEADFAVDILAVL